MALHSALTKNVPDEPPALRTTLLDLVALLSTLTESEQETVEAARVLLASGRVQLTGSFRDRCHEMFS